MELNTMELNMNEMEMVNGGDAMDHFWGAVDGVFLVLLAVPALVLLLPAR